MATSSIPHQIPPAFALPTLPRVRPPRMLPGTASPNTNPQPDEPVPRQTYKVHGKSRISDSVWVQGKWRNLESNAAKDRQHVRSQLVEKALAHQRHGMNIYAYSHIRTKQVVYSLTKVLENSKVMSQLVYHGKKTVPAALRRDMWTPYFSVHFPPTPAGSQAGLTAFQQLRELSLRRQLSPPNELIKTTQADIDRVASKMDPVDLEERRRLKKLKLPIVGQNLPKHLRARKLMDQKATSVADVAFVLKLQSEGATPSERWRERQEALAKKGSDRSRKYRKRLQILAEQRQEREKKIAERAEMVKDVQPGQLKLDSYAAKRISMEYQGRIIEGKVQSLKEIEDAKEAAHRFEKIEREFEEATKAVGSKKVEREATGVADEAERPPEAAQGMQDEHDNSVKILWADLRDGTHAENWPENVVHDELERMAVAMGEKSSRGRSVHVMGVEMGTGFDTAIIEAARETADRQEKMRRATVAGKLQDKLVGMSIRLDRGVYNAAQEGAVQEEEAEQNGVTDAKRALEELRVRKEEFVRTLSKIIKLEFDSLHVDMETTDPGKTPEFEELRKHVADLSARLQNPELLVGEFLNEWRASKSGKGQILPVVEYLMLRNRLAKKRSKLLPLELRKTIAEIGSKPEDSHEFAPASGQVPRDIEQSLKDLKEVYPEFRGYEEELKGVKRSQAERDAEIAKLEALVQKAESPLPPEKAEEPQVLETTKEDAVARIKMLQDLKTDDEGAPVAVWRDLVLRRNATRKATLEATIAKKPEAQQARQSLGWFARVKQSLPFGGRREYSTSARRMSASAKSTRPGKEHRELLNQLTVMRAQLRQAERGNRLDEPGLEAVEIAPSELAAMDVGEETLVERVRVFEAEHPKEAEGVASLHAYRLEQAAQGREIKKWHSEMETVEDSGRKAEMADEIKRLRRAQYDAKKDIKAKMVSLGF